MGGAALAVPAHRGKVTYAQPDGSIISYYVQGDEYEHRYVGLDGTPLRLDSRGFMVQADKSDMPVLSLETSLRRQPKRKAGGPMKMPGKQEMPTTGVVKGIVLLVDFPGITFQDDYTVDVFQRMMNEPEFSLFDGDGSARDYFIAQSDSAFLPEFDVFGVISMNTREEVYAANDEAQVPYMIIDACKAAHDQFGVDFSKYDNDGDGKVDYVYVIYAGHGANYGAPNTIWPHAYMLQYSHQSLTLDGVAIDNYAVSCELHGLGTVLDGIGTFCHEFGHVLGLADLYNTYDQSDTQLGYWDIMDMGCYSNNNRTPSGYSAFERYSLGWLEYDTLDQPMSDVGLEALNTSNKAYRLPSANKENEYFVVENRQQTGWDKYLPGHGMIVTHIDYQPNRWILNTPNNDEPALVDMIEANGKQGYDYEGNSFPGADGITSLTDYTTPNMRGNDGSLTNKAITNIREEDGVILFDLMQDILNAPIPLPATDITDDGFTANWEAVDGAQSYTLHLTQLVSDDRRPELLMETFDGMTEGSYLTPDNTDISANLNDYTSEPGWSGERVYQAGGYAKVGDYGVSGNITTPMIDISQNCDTVTVAFNGRAYTGKTVTIYVKALDADGNSLGQMQQKLQASYSTKAVAFARADLGGRDAVSFRLETSKERAYLDNVRILRGNVGKDDAFIIDVPQQIVEGITATSYTFSGLEPDRYSYRVKAIADTELHNSSYSSPMEVQIGGEGIVTYDRIKIDFEHGMPDNLVLIDNDANTPSSGAAKLGFEVGTPWLIQFIEAESNHVAASISWYKPAGTSDDWMILPALEVKEDATLSWRAMAKDKNYRDGYKVVAIPAVKPAEQLSPDDFANADVLFSIEAEEGAWTFHNLDLEEYVGSNIYIAFVNNSYDKAVLYVDDICAGVAKPVALVRNMPYIAKPSGEFVPSVNVVNETGEVVSGFSVSYKLGGSVVTRDCSALSLDPGQTMEIDFDPIIAEANDNLQFAFSASAAGQDDNMDCDVLIRNRRVVTEEFTGTWCGYCPRGIVAMRRMAELYPDNFVGIALHVDQSATWPDQMAYAEYSDALASEYNIPGYPHSVTQRDRAYVSDPANIPDYVAAEVAQPITAAIDLKLSLSDDQATITATTVSHFNADNEQSDYRIAFVMLEDSVHHPDDRYYSQNNYYAGTSEDMGGFENLPATVPADMMYYSDVARSLVGGIWGFDDALPAAVVAGKGYEYEVEMEIPATVDNIEQVSVVAMLLNTRTQLVENAAKVKLFARPISGINDVTIDNQWNGDDSYYNVYGMKLAQRPSTGIYIYRGKKYMAR